MRRLLQILLPLIVLALAVGAVKWMFANVEKPKIVPPPPNVPLVRTVVAEPATVQLDVHSQGTVEPRTSIPVAAQVSGRVVAIAPTLRAGGFVAAGEVLVRIESADFELAVAQREADVARAELRLAQERAEAAAAVRAWRQLEGDRPADPLTTRALMVQEAEKALAAAQAALQRARLDLQRTAVSLPFDGRVRSADVDVGMLVTAGVPFAEVYGIDWVEVRLPIPDEDARFLELPLDGSLLAGGSNGGGTPDAVIAATGAANPANGGGATRGAADASDGEGTVAGTRVELTADFAGRTHSWTGVVDRVAGEIDRRSRQLTIVARVADPYGRRSAGKPPLVVGMFVQATIAGRRFEDVVALPREALRNDGTVLVVDAERMLRKRPVQVLRQDRRTVYVRGGIEGGERVCVSALETFVEGMPVRLADERQELAPAGQEQGR